MSDVYCNSAKVHGISSNKAADCLGNYGSHLLEDYLFLNFDQLSHDVEIILIEDLLACAMIAYSMP